MEPRIRGAPNTTAAAHSNPVRRFFIEPSENTIALLPVYIRAHKSRIPSRDYEGVGTLTAGSRSEAPRTFGRATLRMSMLRSSILAFAAALSLPSAEAARVLAV